MKKRFLKILIVCLLLMAFTAGAAVCAFDIYALSTGMYTQKAAERWGAGSDMNFAQLSLFFPADRFVALTDVFNFRYAMLDAFKAAALPEPSTGYLFSDAWSTTGKLSVSTDRANTMASVTAVGGDFFSFHLMNVISGGTISENDFMHDRVVLDRELAWLLYGGTDLQGMEISISGKPFVIAGVIDREYDKASREAYTDGMGLYMSYDAYSEIADGASINCYEVVMPEPYSGFAMQTAEKSFDCDGKQIVQNSGRFSLENIYKHTKKLDMRSVQNSPIAYPYWENAARITEDRCSFLLIFTLLFLGADILIIAVITVNAFIKIRDYLDEKAYEKKHRKQY